MEEKVPSRMCFNFATLTLLFCLDVVYNVGCQLLFVVSYLAPKIYHKAVVATRPDT